MSSACPLLVIQKLVTKSESFSFQFPKVKRQEIYKVSLLTGRGFPDSSGGKESARSAGDLGSILGWEDPLETRKATHSSVLT